MLFLLSTQINHQQNATVTHIATMIFKIPDQSAQFKINKYLKEHNLQQKYQDNQSIIPQQFPYQFNITIGLFASDAPATVSNFINLAQRPDKLSYINKKIHFHNNSNWFQLGDNDYLTGITGYSVFGGKYSKEINKLDVHKYSVCMRIIKKYQVSQFMFILKEQDPLDMTFGTVFGHILKGYEELHLLDEILQNQNPQYIGMQENVIIKDIIIEQIQNPYQIQFY